MGLYRTKFSRRPAIGSPSLVHILTYLAVGLVAGISLGYILMGTAHAVLETRGTTHFASTGTSDTNGVERGSHQVDSTKAAGNDNPDSIHTLATSNGSPYQNYQMRIAFATYNIIRTMPGGDIHVAFTRILHRTKPDELMDEIPTFQATPLQPKCDDWCEYPVSDRANAVRQFFEAANIDKSMIKARWLYMIESDYVFMKPLPPPPSGAGDGQAWAYPFDYINPRGHTMYMRKLYPESAGPIEAIPNTGPAPILMTRNDWEKVTPDWERLAAMIEGHEGMKSSLGWVREMYGFSVALALHKIHTDLTPSGKNRFISQLPIDSELGDAHAFHYTQCTIYKTVAGNEDVWKYDKRFYTTAEDALKVKLIEEPPQPFKPGEWKFIEGNAVTQEKHESITQMIRQMNRGIATLKELRAVV